MVCGRLGFCRYTTWIFLNIIWSRYSALYYKAREKEQRHDARYLSFPQANVVTCFWNVQCLCAALVLGHSICVLHLRLVAFCFLPHASKKIIVAGLHFPGPFVCVWS